jgi:hypothetical protein
MNCKIIISNQPRSLELFDFQPVIRDWQSMMRYSNIERLSMVDQLDWTPGQHTYTLHYHSGISIPWTMGTCRELSIAGIELLLSAPFFNGYSVFLAGGSLANHFSSHYFLILTKEMPSNKKSEIVNSGLLWDPSLGYFGPYQSKYRVRSLTRIHTMDVFNAERYERQKNYKIREGIPLFIEKRRMYVMKTSQNKAKSELRFEVYFHDRDSDFNIFVHSSDHPNTAQIFEHLKLAAIHSPGKVVFR